MSIIHVSLGFLLLIAPAQGTVKSADGVDIRYEARGSGSPPIVFVHGWSCDRTYWRAQIEHFAKWHQVVAVDLGGHGESGLGRKQWTVESFGADVKAVLDALDLTRAVLVGHSMGGPVILEAFRRASDRIAALVPVDTLFEVGASFGPQEREQFLSPLRADFQAGAGNFVRQWMFTKKSDRKLVERIASDMASAPPDVALSAIESLFDYDEAAALAAVTVPVRLLNADWRSTDLAAARKYKEDVGLAVMPGVGHFLMAEDPEEFNRLLARAIRELTAPASRY
jgi:pimeloyl-ACP methyl ester carboxylesterase